MLDAKTGTLHDPSLISQAEMYWGAVMMAKGKPDEASSIFEKLLLRDAHYEPDPLSFPTDVLDAFVDTRAKFKDRLNAKAQETAKRDAERKAREIAEKQAQVARVKMLERLASEEKITDRHSRFIATLPFGVGQFQNGQTALGWTFLGSEAALVLANVITIPLFLAEVKGAHDDYVPATNRFATSVGQAHLDRANTYWTLNHIFFGAFAAAAVIGVAHAHLTYVPDVEITKKRSLPPPPTLLPAAQPVMTEKGVTGAIVGVCGVF